MSTTPAFRAIDRERTTLRPAVASTAVGARTGAPERSATERYVTEGHNYASVNLANRGPVAGVAPKPEMWSHDGIVLARMSGLHLDAVRSQARIDEAPSDTIKLAFLDAGRAIVRQNGREAHLEAGDFTLIDCSRPYRYTIDGRYELRVFQFSTASLGITDGDLSAVTATALSQQHALSAYLMPFLVQLSTRGVKSHPSTRLQLARTVTDILATLIRDRLNDMPLHESARRTLLVRIKAFIVAHLDNAELSPELVATEHFISVRYLHKLFASEGISVSRWTLAARLERCRTDLASSSPSSNAIFGVARQWGFSSPAHFSRAFRAAYGMSAREWQASARRLPA